jgi:hypothetical protein
MSSNVQVLVWEMIPESPGGTVGGIVSQGTAPDQQQGARETAHKVIRKVIDISSEKIVESVVEIGNKIGPTLKKNLEGLTGISVSEVSIGCAIGGDGNIIVAGVAAEASLTITFKVS